MAATPRTGGSSRFAGSRRRGSTEWGIHRPTRCVSNAWANNPAPIRSASGFEPSLIDESKAPSRFKKRDDAPHTPAGPRPKLYSLTYGDAADLALSEATNPLIEDLLGRSELSVWFGELGAGKTFVMLDAAWHIAAGRAWGGRPVQQGLVIYIATEGSKSLFKRLAALRLRHPDIGTIPLHVIPCPVDLLRPEADLKPLLALMREIETRSGSRVDLIVIDTLSRALAGGDENGPSDMGRFVSNIDQIRLVTAGHVAIVHHSGKDDFKGARRHSLLRAAADTEIKISRKGAQRTLKATKQRDGEEGQDLPFALRPMRIGLGANGKEVRSCYVELGKAGETPGGLPLAPDQEALANKLESTLREKGTLGLPFPTSFIIECAARLSPENGRVHAQNPEAFRAHVKRMMDEMDKKGHLKKPQRGQWLLVDGRNGQKWTL